MENLNIIIYCLTVPVIVICFYIIISFLCDHISGIIAGILIVICSGAFFFTLGRNTQKDIYINNEKIKINNISYYCPSCNTLIPSITAKYCTACGLSVEHINNNLRGK